MFDKISDGFRKAAERFQKNTTFTEENIKEALGDIRGSLLEADVAYSVVKEFLENLEAQVVGQKIELVAGTKDKKIRVTPGQHFIGVCQKELEKLLGGSDGEDEAPIKWPKNRPTVIMMIGLQGTGKTTTAAKLAKLFKERDGRQPLLAAGDIYRPAAADQLKVLGDKIGCPVYHRQGASPLEICKEAIQKAYDLDCDTVILDTAGRLTIDEALMGELKEIKGNLKPDQIYLVCDAMMGQDAVTTGKAFHEALGIDGFIMTKLDGDARGGAALSIRAITGKPIRFIGVGEDVGRLEVFRAKGLASRILGMGDVVSLMEDYERLSREDKEDDIMRIMAGQFNFLDFYEQINVIQKMGSLKDIIAKLPMQNMIPKDVVLDDKILGRFKSIIDSMTPKERLYPDLVEGSRAKRIAKGSGSSLSSVQELVQKTKAMRNVMGQMGGGGLMGKIPGLKNLGRLNDMRKMFSGGMGNMGDLFGGGGMEQGNPGKSYALPKPDRDKVKKARKQAQKNRNKRK
jgi:signal recognition particle subunit SRP54